MILSPDQESGVEAILASTLRAQVLTGCAGCLTADTEIIVNRAGKGARMPIAHVVHMFNGGLSKNKRAWDPSISTRVQCRQDGFGRLGFLEAAFQSGTKEIFTLHAGEASLRATAEHPFLTTSGWARMDELRPGDRVLRILPPVQGRRLRKPYYPCVGGMKNHPFHGYTEFDGQRCEEGRRGKPVHVVQYRVPKHRLVVEAIANGLEYEDFVQRVREGSTEGLTFFDPELLHVHHRNRDTRDARPENLEVLPMRSHHQEHGEDSTMNVLWREAATVVETIERTGEEETFDLTLAEEPHNYTANGFVVHNTGKTFLMNVIAERALERWRSVEFIASTGRAASRLRDVVGAGVLTAHAAHYGYVKEERKLVKDASGKEKTVRTGKLQFGAPKAPCSPGSLLICDEGSMINDELHTSLMQYLPPGATLLYVGDREQLPPVEGTWGPDFDNPTAVLDTVHRQAWENPIIRLATSIRRSEDFDWDREYAEMSYRRGKVLVAATWLAGRLQDGADATLLTFTNAKRRSANTLVRQLLGLGGIIAPRDTLVCLANNYELGVMNGETFSVTAVEPVVVRGNRRFREPPMDALLVRTQDTDFLVNPALLGATTTDFKDFQRELEANYGNKGNLAYDTEVFCGATERDPELWKMSPKEMARTWMHVDHGFCLTAHKAQGSEFTEVGFMRCWALSRKEEEEPDFARRLNYTAVTRARERLHIWDI